MHHSTPRRWLAIVFSLAACTNDSPPELESSSGENAETSEGSGSTSSTQPPGSTSSPSTSTTGGIDTDETDRATDEDTGAQDDAGLVGCPEAMPDDWILCESFDGITDPWNELGAFVSIDGALAVEEGPSRSGHQSLRIRQIPETDWGGWAVLRFGRGPSGAVVHAPREDFDEVWVRFWTRTPLDWPDGGMGDLVEVQALSTEGSAIAADATVLGPTGSLNARLIGWSCIHEGELLCNGLNDWGNPNLVARAFTSGQAPIFGQQHAGEWHCAVLHVKLDEPGSSDGSITLSVDGELDAQLDGLELLGTWSGTRLNAVKFSSWWPDVPHPLERHIDDVVVATSPLACPPHG